MDNPAKCAHPPCKCTVAANSEFDEFCSEHCRDAKDLTEVRCDCKHPACN